MTHRRSLILSGAFLIFLAASGSHPVEAQPGDLSTRIDAIAQAALEDGRVAGISVAVVRAGDVVHARGYGFADIAKEIPATDETVYVIASVTKLLTAATVMRLVDAGRLRLDDTLAALLPDFPNREQAERITLRHLLNHTSGLPDILSAHMEAWAQSGAPLAPGFVLDYLDGRPLDFAPGTNWSYTNTGVYLAGLVIERVTGTPYGTAVHELLAEPLDLPSLFLCDENRLPERRTVGYTPGDAGLVKTPIYDTAGTQTGYRAAGGFCSSARDLARLPDGLRSGRGLSSASLLAMLHPTALAGGMLVDYGLGVRRGSLDGHTVWGHTGGHRSTWAIVAHYPDDALTIAVLVNTEGVRNNAWLLEGRIARAALDLGSPRIDARPMSPDALQIYAGRYEDVRGNRQFVISAQDDQLQVAVVHGEGPATRLVHLGEHAFGFPDAPMDRLVFHMDQDRAQGYSLYYDGLFFNFRRRVEQ